MLGLTPSFACVQGDLSELDALGASQVVSDKAPFALSRILPPPTAPTYSQRGEAAPQRGTIDAVFNINDANSKLSSNPREVKPAAKPAPPKVRPAAS